jgi:hypothetical protein
MRCGVVVMSKFKNRHLSLRKMQRKGILFNSEIIVDENCFHWTGNLRWFEKWLRPFERAMFFQLDSQFSRLKYRFFTSKYRLKESECFRRPWFRHENLGGPGHHIRTLTSLFAGCEGKLQCLTMILEVFIWIYMQV